MVDCKGVMVFALAARNPPPHSLISTSLLASLWDYCGSHSKHTESRSIPLFLVSCFQSHPINNLCPRQKWPTQSHTTQGRCLPHKLHHPYPVFWPDYQRQWREKHLSSSFPWSEYSVTRRFGSVGDGPDDSDSCDMDCDNCWRMHALRL